MLLGSSPTESWLSGRLHRKSLLLRPPLQDRRPGGQWTEILLLHAETFILSFIQSTSVCSLSVFITSEKVSQDLTVTLIAISIILYKISLTDYTVEHSSKMPVNLYMNYSSDLLALFSQTLCCLTREFRKIINTRILKTWAEWLLLNDSCLSE